MNKFTSRPLNITDDDYIGNESCMDLQNDIVVEHTSSVLKRSSNKNKVQREFPPPIPLLSNDSSNQSYLVSWALKRYHTSDGRLILKEEKVKKHCKYFQAHRSNGRLTLELLDPLEEDNEEEEEDQDDNEVDMENDEGGVHSGTSSLNCNIAGSSQSYVFGVPMHQIRTVHG